MKITYTLEMLDDLDPELLGELYCIVETIGEMAVYEGALGVRVSTDVYDVADKIRKGE